MNLETWKGPQEDSTPSCLSEMEAWFLFDRLVSQLSEKRCSFEGSKTWEICRGVQWGSEGLWCGDMPRSRKAVFFFVFSFPYVIVVCLLLIVGTDASLEVFLGFWLKRLISWCSVCTSTQKMKMKRCEEPKKLGWTNQSTAYRRRKNAATVRHQAILWLQLRHAATWSHTSELQPRNQSHPSMAWSVSNMRPFSAFQQKKNAPNLGSQSDLRAWHLGSLNSKYRGWLTPMNCMEMTWNS